MTVTEMLDHRIESLKLCKEQWSEKISRLDCFDEQINRVEKIKESRDHRLAGPVAQDVLRFSRTLSGRQRDQVHDLYYHLQAGTAQWD